MSRYLTLKDVAVGVRFVEQISLTRTDNGEKVVVRHTCRIVSFDKWTAKWVCEKDETVCGTRPNADVCKEGGFAMNERALQFMRLEVL